jgi:hypothetical protein
LFSQRHRRHCSSSEKQTAELQCGCVTVRGHPALSVCRSPRRGGGIFCTALRRRASRSRRFRNPLRPDWRYSQPSANCLRASVYRLAPWPPPRPLKAEVSAAAGRKVETLESWRPMRHTAPLDTKRWSETAQVLCRLWRERERWHAGRLSFHLPFGVPSTYRISP